MTRLGIPMAQADRASEETNAVLRNASSGRCFPWAVLQADRTVPRLEEATPGAVFPTGLLRS
jgi:hypothetical protein